jgi:sugar lactone lactonase YvrE
MRRTSIAYCIFSMIISGCTEATVPQSQQFIASNVRENVLKRNIYVGNFSTVTSYRPNGKITKYVISKGIFRPSSMLFDSSGNLYVANHGEKQVTVYAPGKTEPSRVIKDGIGRPTSLAIDRAGNLYVSNQTKNTITVYPPGSGKPSLTVSNRVSLPSKVVVDSLGNIYVANQGDVSTNRDTVSVYDSEGNYLRTVIPANEYIYDIALDGQDQLYVASDGFPGGIVAVYQAYSGNIVRTIPINDIPFELAIDSKETLYVLVGDEVVVYDYGTTSPAYAITDSTHDFISIGLDGKDDLFAGDYEAKTVTAYAPGSKTPYLNISKGIDDPRSFAFGP